MATTPTRAPSPTLAGSPWPSRGKIAAWILIPTALIFSVYFSVAWYNSTDSSSLTPIASLGAALKPSTASAPAPQGETLSACTVPAKIYTLKPGEELRPPRAGCAFGGNASPLSDINKFDVKTSASGKDLIYIKLRPGVTEAKIEMVFCDKDMWIEGTLSCRSAMVPVATRQYAAANPPPANNSGIVIKRTSRLIYEGR